MCSVRLRMSLGCRFQFGRVSSSSLERSAADAYCSLLIKTGANPLERNKSAKLEAITLSLSDADWCVQLPSRGD